MSKNPRALLFCGALAILAAAGGAQAAIKSEKSEGIPELRPPQGPVAEPVDEHAQWPWFLAAACLVTSAILLWPRKPAVVNTEAPAVTARRALSELRRPDPVAIGQLLRTYIIATHAVPGPGQTFQQLTDVLERDARWSPALRERFRQLADPIEIAKFAPDPTTSDWQELRVRALALIEESDALNRPAVPAPR